MEDDLEDDIKLVDIMGPKQAYEKFEDELLKQLPADQPNFIALLEKEGVIDGEAKKKMNLPNRSNNKIICTAVILSVIEKSLSDSDEKFNTLLKVMEEYKNGLESLALKIRNHLDPVGTPFVCETMREYLWRNNSSLSNLPYNKMKYDLLTYEIITSEEKRQLAFENNEKSQMYRVLYSIHSSLCSKQTRKFKRFLELMEESGDQLLERTAKKLGGSKRVPDIGEATAFKIVLIPVGHSEKVECNGKFGGSYLWKGHDFGITLPPDCADGAVNITLEAYLPSSTQKHCLASAVFEITTNVKKFKKPITLTFPHWVNIKSDTDKEKLCFLVFQSYPYYTISYEIQKGSFQVGESLGSIEVSDIRLICIYKKFAAARFAFTKDKYFQFHTDQILRSYETDFMTQAIVNLEEGYTTESTGETTENKYLDLLVLPEGHDEKWGIYCIALDNPTYLQAVMKYFIDENHINSAIKILKRQVVFKPSTDDAAADLCIVDTKADGKIIKILLNKKILKQKIDSLDIKLKSSIFVNVHEINFPMWCSLNIIGKLSPSSSKLEVVGMCGVNEESSEFSLASPEEHGYKFENYQHVEPDIIKKPSQPKELAINKDMITETTIAVSWKEPNPSDVPIVGYEVEYRKSGEKFKKVEKSLIHEDLTCEVTRLAAHTEYEFRVAAINAAGCGPFTDVVTQFTKPSQPKELAINKDKITETTIAVSWKEPNPSDVPIVGYEVEYRKSGEKFKKVEKSLIHEDLTCEVTRLAAHTEYEFRVAAVNAAGCGPFTDVVTQFTSFDYSGTAKQLRRQLDKLSKLSYENMEKSLFANEVITTQQKKIIANKIGHDKMEYLIVEVIIPSLEQGFGKKYKYFLKAMEDSEDTDLQGTAKMLGGSERVPADTTQTKRKRQKREESSDTESENGIKSKASKKIMQSPELSVALSCACRSVSDAWGLKRLDGMNLNGINLNGTGTVIAILDTGIDQDSPSFTGKEFSCIDCLPGVPVASTVHGTICSAVAVGLQSDTTPRGVAPCAQLIVYRIAEGCYASIEAILAALQDIQNKLESGIQIDVVSLSYDCDENSEDAIRNKIDELTKKGIAFVAAAGNRGQYQARACIPARFDNVISVGALGKHGLKTDFTPPVNIDVYAPGEDIKFPSIEDKLSGTSYATPAVAGLVLLLKQWANHVGSPAKENINRVEILRSIFRKEIQVKSEDGSTDIFDPVEFFVRMKGNPTMLNNIVQEYLDEENVMEH